MYNHRILGILFFIGLCALPLFSYAQSLGISQPVGGKVVKVGKSETLVCAATVGPIFITPFNIAPPGPFFIRLSTSGRPKKGGYIIGNYSVVPDIGTCYNPETGAPIPAFELKPYGVSR